MVDLAVWYAFLATLFTWGVTALGAALVFVLPTESSPTTKMILDLLLGFAGGVMTAASFWSLLAPALEAAGDSYEAAGMSRAFAIIPVGFGFAVGGYAMHAADYLLDRLGAHGDTLDLVRATKGKKYEDDESTVESKGSLSGSSKRDSLNRRKAAPTSVDPLARAAYKRSISDAERGSSTATAKPSNDPQSSSNRWRRVMLLVLAITIHNFPEGLAVGVGFGTAAAQGTGYGGAKSLAIGIALQNFPEGLAVSMPLRREGMSYWESFLWGQLSGLVEPIGGVLGAYAVLIAKPILPYALAFAAGAMIFVVVDQLVPEAHEGSKRVATGGFMAGFLVMMAMDVGLG